MQNSWDKVCAVQSLKCSGCVQCFIRNATECPETWFSYQKHCYKVNMVKQNYYDARQHCVNEGGLLVSINNEKENQFAWKLCHSEPDPITYPKLASRSTCWIGLYEQPGTGTVETPQAEQKWLWLDGTSPEINGYKNWAQWPGLGDGNGDGNKFGEPNNQRTAASGGFNVRHALMNKPEGGYQGKWYDEPAEPEAHAMCEKEAVSSATTATAGAATEPAAGTAPAMVRMPPGWETRVPMFKGL